MLTDVVLLTDVVVLVTRSKLEAEAEGGEELELLGELEGAVGALRPVALPAFEAPPPVVAGGVAVVVHHVQHVVLHELARLRLLVVRTVDIQIVVDGHLHGVLAQKEPGRRSDVISCWLTFRMTEEKYVREPPPPVRRRWEEISSVCRFV